MAENKQVAFRVDSQGWICIYDKFDDVIIAAREIRPLRKPGTGSSAHRTQEATAKGNVHITPKREYDLKNLMSNLAK